MHARVHTHTLTRVHTHTRTHTHAHTHARTHTQTHIHTQAAKSVGKTLKAFQPTIREVVEASQDIKGTLEQVLGRVVQLVCVCVCDL